MGDRGPYHNGVGSQVHRTARLIRGVDTSLSDDGTVTIELLDKGFNNLIVGPVGFGALPGVAAQRRPDEVGSRFSSEESVINRATIGHDDDVVFTLEAFDRLGQAQPVGTFASGAVEGDDVSPGS